MRYYTLLLCLTVHIACFLSEHIVIGKETATVTAADPESATSVTTDESSAHDEEQAKTATKEKSSVTDQSQKDATSSESEDKVETEEEPFQAGPLIDLFGPKLQSLKLVDETSAQISEQYTNEALKGKNVIGIYFSADWCGPCRQFTPELVSFYHKMNKRRGQKDKFQIIWVSRCRDVNSHYQYFTHMPWLALPPEEATGARGEMLSNKYKVKGIPTLVLVDDLGQTITTDARNKIPQDKAGIGFPWRNPLSQICSIVFPRPLRMMVKLHLDAVRSKLVHTMKGLFGLGKK
ncbi:alkyl hydroperoxide reductase [Nitzschia inconspicua]|uniref:Alkyl hydroperoxide reductase n=1 Tax=Nitzschia inconspicua TaxID=303405 RepID=A0A9K3KVP1_9STRA|nr:alkyl hydroperoxide reductase [Nitzschia inconspicua]